MIKNKLYSELWEAIICRPLRDILFWKLARSYWNMLGYSQEDLWDSENFWEIM